MRRPLPGLALWLVVSGCGGDEPPGRGDDAGPVVDGGGDAGDAIDSGVDPCLDVICDEGNACAQGECVPCSGQPGTFHGQSIQVDGQDRRYLLHVPASYDCRAAAAPLWIDFHGTALEPPEEAWATDEIVALADDEGIVLVRPRSLSSLEDGVQIFRWDQNDGDLERNLAFARALIEDVEARYRIDPERVFASGFSNGTNMTARLLGDAPDRLRGAGFVGGGLWGETTVGDLSQTQPRIWAVTGARDYMLRYQRQLLDALSAAGLSSDQVLRHETDACHELYGWQLREMWEWMNGGSRPADVALSDAWTVELDTPQGQSLTEIARAPDGEVVAVGGGGLVLSRDGGGSWSVVAQLDDDGYVPVWEGLCFTAGGRGLVVGDRVRADRDAGGAWTVRGPVPEIEVAVFGASHLNGIACGPGERVVGGGYWTSVVSDDGGLHWDALDAFSEGVPAQIAAVGIGPSGTVIEAGYGFVGRSAGGAAAVDVRPAVDAAWLSAVAAGPNGIYWVAGDGGTVLRSDDDGRTWADQTIPDAPDLYAIAFADADHGLVVGDRGAAYWTDDGGQTFRDVAPGPVGFLGGVVWLDATTALVVGAPGVLRFDAEAVR